MHHSTENQCVFQCPKRHKIQYSQGFSRCNGFLRGECKFYFLYYHVRELKSESLSSFSPFQAILRKETNIVQKGELQEEVIAKIQQARPAERWGERPKQGRHAFTTRIRHCGPPTARDFYTPWYKTVLRAFTPSQGTAGQRSFVPVRTAARPMDLIAWKRVLDGRTMSGYSNCIEYLSERQSTFAMWKFAACVSELLVFRR